MKISLNWLKKYVNVTVSDQELVRLIGARLVEVEGVIDETHKYDKIYVVKVLEANKIPETHLTLCKIDCGETEPVQVVCGAPNVRVGMLAVWIAPGAVVPASVNEDAPFVIGKRKMQGYESCGMLAGADELDFGDDHSGIVEIDPEMAKPGDLLADIFELNDLIFEIENKSLTHRPDTFGMIGFAREVAGILGEKFSFISSSRAIGANSATVALRNTPRLKENFFSKTQSKIQISIADDKICPRYSAIVLEKHGEIKKKYLTWMDTILSKSGMRPVDPIVDTTNYLMLLTGQPLHAFDYDKFVAAGGSGKPKIIIRLAKQGEKLVLLDGKEIELNENDIVICSNDTPVALAGAMGGLSTAIDENTRNIILESATFSLYNLRKTQMAHGIFSEAITRFTKGQPPYQTLAVAEDFAGLLSDGFVMTSMVDNYPKPEKENVVKITTEEINRLLGTNYDDSLIIQTLENVGFEVKNKRSDLTIKAPLWRMDIHIKEDIIEEIGRLLGYDNILPTLPLHATSNTNKMLSLKTNIRSIMKSFGANELLTYSFISERLLKKAGLDEKNSYKIVNSISPDLQFVRQTIVPSLLEKAYVNQKIPFDKFAIYEMNKVYQKSWGMDAEEVPVEKMRLGFVLAERKNPGAAYYKAKYYLEKLFGEICIKADYLSIKNKTPETLPFEVKRAAEVWVGERMIGVLGEFKNSVRHNFKLGEYLAGFELDLDALLELGGTKKIDDGFEVCEKIDETVTTSKTYGETLAEIEKKYQGARITPVGIYQPEGATTKNITFHIEK
ncbi:phenylalanine--tRNA ligase subunit beta [Candidatus Saccharibacteria bacterium]|nr:phenylalanine--tRNA ligase subunit beta [Candidatus Saccharibacteria bacterium]